MAMTQACPSCRAALPPDAKFCPACGSTVGAHTCACGTALGPQARFCHKCGRPAGGAAAAAPSAAPSAAPVAVPDSPKTPWVVAGVLIVALLGTIIWRAYENESKKSEAPVMANAGNAQSGDPGAGGPVAPFAQGAGGVPEGRAPDISKMTPKERFARLFNRIMMAGERGDSVTVTNFSPMALSAYEQLPERDQGDRFDAGLLHLQIGDLPAAKALADTIRQTERTSLLSDALAATIARAEGSSAGELAALKTFKANWTAEQAKKRPEYELRSGLLTLVKARADSIVK